MLNKFSSSNRIFCSVNRSRAYAAGFVAAFSYIIAFVASKSYYNLEVAISLPGVTCLYGSFGLLGYVSKY